MLYVFAPNCPWCLHNKRNIRELFVSKSSSFQFVGLSLTTKDQTLALGSYRPVFTSYCGPSDDIKRKLELGGTPQTILISEDGTVLHNWPGAYRGTVQASIERYFGVTLPGLS